MPAVMQMDQTHKIGLVDIILERAAETAGDITQAVMTDFYNKHPKAKAHFLHHFPANTEKLEANMVEQALYCLMDWYQSPNAVEILLQGSVPHHMETLNIPADIYNGLLQSTARVVSDTIPSENRLEIEVWNEARNRLQDVISESSQYACSTPE